MVLLIVLAALQAGGRISGPGQHAAFVVACSITRSCAG
jgi:hypothetical protein